MAEQMNPAPRRKGTLGQILSGERELRLREKLMLVALGILLCLVVALGIGFAILIRPPQRSHAKQADAEHTTQVEKTDQDTGETYTVEVPLSLREGYYNILICGTDDSGLRTDTMMIARLDTNTHETAVVSVPRDTLCRANNSSEVPKLNSIYAYGGLRDAGMQMLMDELEYMFGFRPDAYVLVNLDCFVEAIDILGGVDFDVPQSMQYNDAAQDLFIDLTAGPQHLTGEQAMELCRFRGYPMADIQRCSVQQDFVQQLAQQCLDGVGFSEIQKLARLGQKYVTTDLSTGNMIYFGRELLNCDLTQMESATLPGVGTMVQDGSYWVLNEQGTLDTINELINPYDHDLSLQDMNLRTAEE